VLGVEPVADRIALGARQQASYTRTALRVRPAALAACPLVWKIVRIN
jgi:hypothetical protein